MGGYLLCLTLFDAVTDSKEDFTTSREGGKTSDGNWAFSLINDAIIEVVDTEDNSEDKAAVVPEILKSCPIRTIHAFF
ncbi:hypothetical protein PAXRUDRAFT_21898 [Paxillus rubicundulus Ve08.2h10]|uniref:Uncharacterized protein n=1 Tax=Paxillus rubicundulus Ve08.2h10 TaxID=930991 RepID=A0A0D0D6K9_9AGAM|nr:hypothetical protein PAXRUDRAFT_21898 [Paxillus rubicundulus Ve08.2h10]